MPEEKYNFDAEITGRHVDVSLRGKSHQEASDDFEPVIRTAKHAKRMTHDLCSVLGVPSPFFPGILLSK